MITKEQSRLMSKGYDKLINFIFRWGIGLAAIIGFWFFTNLGALTDYKFGSWMWLDANDTTGNLLKSNNDALLIIADVYTYTIVGMMMVGFFGTKIKELVEHKQISEEEQFKLNLLLRVPFVLAFMISVGQSLVALLAANEMIFKVLDGTYAEVTIWIYLFVISIAIFLTFQLVLSKSDKAEFRMVKLSNYTQMSFVVTMITSLLMITHIGAFGIDLSKAIGVAAEDNKQDIVRIASDLYGFNEGFIWQKGIIEATEKVFNNLIPLDSGFDSFDFGSPGDYSDSIAFGNAVFNNSIILMDILEKPAAWGINNNWQFIIITIFYSAAHLFIMIVIAYGFFNKNKTPEEGERINIKNETYTIAIVIFYIYSGSFYIIDQTIIAHTTSWNPNLTNGDLIELCKYDYDGTGYYWFLYSQLIVFLIAFFSIIVFPKKQEQEHNLILNNICNKV